MVFPKTSSQRPGPEIPLHLPAAVVPYSHLQQRAPTLGSRDIIWWRPSVSATKSSAPADQSDPADVHLAQIERIGARIQAAHDAVAKVIFGQKAVIEESLITLL